ncbi:MAG: hypothetical protein H7Y07_01690 [Pyrinomonadaceae bacterium]|nr:hypothetical protein [Sphingobacteriaceae bacterium]
MKKLFILLSFIAVTATSYAQLSDDEYSYVTMDLQGILNLTMTNDPTVNFSFKSIADYQQGVVKYNATRLSVDATVAWDLFAYASSNNWTQTDAYSTNGVAVLPAEILEVQSERINTSTAAATFNAFTSLKGLTNSGVSAAGVPTAATQYLAGGFGTGAARSYLPGSALGSPNTNQFRIHYRLVPGIPATFPNNTSVALGAPGYAQAGYYYLEVVYALIEDL